MNIAFDAKRAFLNQSGLGNYARTLIKSFIQYFPGNHYTLFTTGINQTAFSEYIKEQKNVTVVQPQWANRLLPAYWRSYGITKLLSKNDIQVYHGLSNELPFNISQFNGKKIVTIHDLLFLRYPEFYPLADRKIYDSKFRAACENADVIVAVSEQTKRDIERFYFISADKIKVIYQGCNEVFYSEPSIENNERVKKKYNLPDQYLLCVGTIEERKNLLTVVKALTFLDNIPLVVIGKKKEYFTKVSEFISRNNIRRLVIFPEDVLTEDLPAIYKNATVFIYPSSFEGFGIPIIEALTCRTPVITSKEAVFYEAGGPDSVYIDSHHHEQLAGEIKKLLASPSLCKAIAEKGWEYSQKFHPEKIAMQLIDLYSE
jgi:glycosyltransferase involved in cell wall biosynthesis